MNAVFRQVRADLNPVEQRRFDDFVAHLATRNPDGRLATDGQGRPLPVTQEQINQAMTHLTAPPPTTPPYQPGDPAPAQPADFSELGTQQQGPVTPEPGIDQSTLLGESALSAQDVLSGSVDRDGRLIAVAEGDPLRAAADRIGQRDGRFLVVIHGSSDQLYFNGRSITVDQLAEIIRSSTGWNSQDIDLFSCDTGGRAATQLAEMLGVRVDAPTAKAWVMPDGSVAVAPEFQGRYGPQPDLHRPGSWRSHGPDGTVTGSSFAPDSEQARRTDPRHELLRRIQDRLAELDPRLLSILRNPAQAVPATGAESPATQDAEARLLADLTPEEQTALQDAVTAANPVADAALRDLRDIVTELNPGLPADQRVDLLGEEHRVKGLASLARKFAVEFAPFGVSVQEFLGQVDDLVRFSVRSPDGHHYGVTVGAVIDSLLARGYQVRSVENYWKPGNSFLGCAAFLTAPNGHRVEIQFPTDASWAIGKQTHRLYEIVRLATASPVERVHALLQDVRIIKESGIFAALPDLSTLPEPEDLNFAGWAAYQPAVMAEYGAWLAQQGVSFDEVLARHDLDRSDLPGFDPDTGFSGQPHPEPTSDPDPAPARDARDAEARLLADLTPQDRAALSEAVANAGAVADTALGDLREIIGALNPALPADQQADLLGEKYRVKGQDSLARKFALEFAPHGVSADQFLGQIGDLVRFSVLSPEGQHYGATVTAVLDQLTARGYRVASVKNRWKAGNNYLGCAASLITPGGQRMELQFPTARSWSVEKLTHRLYEIVRLRTALPVARVHALLHIVRIIKDSGIPATVPDLTGLPDPQDFNFAGWAAVEPAVMAEYGSWLAQQGTTFGEVLRQRGLELSDLAGFDPHTVFGTEGAGDVLLPGGVPVEPDRGPDRPDRGAAITRAAPRGDLEPPPGGVDVQPGGRGTTDLRPAQPPANPADRSGRGGTDRPGSRDGTADRSGAAPDLRSGLDPDVTTALRKLAGIAAALDSIEAKNPGVAGVTELRDHLADFDAWLRQDPDPSDPDLPGVLDEIDVWVANTTLLDGLPGVTHVSTYATGTLPDGEPLQIPLTGVTHDGRRLVQTRFEPPTHVRSPEAYHLVREALDQLRLLAFDPDLHHDGGPRQLIWYFGHGVDPSLAGLLRRIRITDPDTGEQLPVRIAVVGQERPVSPPDLSDSDDLSLAGQQGFPPEDTGTLPQHAVQGYQPPGIAPELRVLLEESDFGDDLTAIPLHDPVVHTTRVMPQLPDRLLVDIHGQHDQVRYDFGTGKRSIGPAEFADVIRNTRRWRQYEDALATWERSDPATRGLRPELVINLVSCWTANGFAAQLSRQLGVDVIAPTLPAVVDPDGHVDTCLLISTPYGAVPVRTVRGEWVRFTPDGSEWSADLERDLWGAQARYSPTIRPEPVPIAPGSLSPPADLDDSLRRVWHALRRDQARVAFLRLYDRMAGDLEALNDVIDTLVHAAADHGIAFSEAMIGTLPVSGEPGQSTPEPSPVAERSERVPAPRPAPPWYGHRPVTAPIVPTTIAQAPTPAPAPSPDPEPSAIRDALARVASLSSRFGSRLRAGVASVLPKSIRDSLRWQHGPRALTATDIAGTRRLTSLGRSTPDGTVAARVVPGVVEAMRHVLGEQIADLQLVGADEYTVALRVVPRRGAPVVTVVHTADLPAGVRARSQLAADGVARALTLSETSHATHQIGLSPYLADDQVAPALAHELAEIIRERGSRVNRLARMVLRRPLRARFEGDSSTRRLRVTPEDAGRLAELDWLGYEHAWLFSQLTGPHADPTRFPAVQQALRDREHDFAVAIDRLRLTHRWAGSPQRRALAAHYLSPYAMALVNRLVQQTWQPPPPPSPEPEPTAETSAQRYARLRAEAVDGDEAVDRVRNGPGWVDGDRPAGITDAMIEALRRYTSVIPLRYRRMNGGLRELARDLSQPQRDELARRPVTGPELAATDVYGEVHDAERDEVAEADAAAINLIDQAFQHARPATGPVRLHRQIYNPELLFGRRENLVGMEVDDAALMSTSAEFGSYEVSTWDRVEITIYADTGAKLIYTAPLGGGPAHEREVLLPRGSVLKIISERTERGILKLEAELIGGPAWDQDQSTHTEETTPTPTTASPGTDPSKSSTTHSPGPPAQTPAPATSPHPATASPGTDPSTSATTHSGTAPETTPDRLPVTTLDGLQRVGPQLGSNLGGRYQDASGRLWYVKVPPTPGHARNEALANLLYRLAGVEVPQVDLVDVTGQFLDRTLGLRSAIVDGQSDLRTRIGDEAYQRRVRADFAVDAWLANWDVAGMLHDNIITRASDSQPVRIDAGGCLLHRATGGPKGDRFGPEVTELESLRDPRINPVAARVFDGVTDAEIRHGVARVQAISPEQIDAAVDAAGFSGAEASHLKHILRARRQDLIDRYGEPGADQPPGPGSAHPAPEPETQAERLARLRNQAASGAAAVDRITHGRDWKTQLLPALRDRITSAVRRYTGGHHLRIDRALRALAQGLAPQQRRFAAQRPVTVDRLAASGAYSETDLAWAGDLDAATIAHLDQAFRHAPPTTGPVRLHRLIPDPDAWFGRSAGVVGTEFIDHGYVSASANPREPGEGGAGAVRLTIYADAGARLLYAGPTATAGREPEVLLPRGSVFRIISERHEPDGPVWEAELVGGPAYQMDGQITATDLPGSGVLDRARATAAPDRVLADARAFLANPPDWFTRRYGLPELAGGTAGGVVGGTGAAVRFTPPGGTRFEITLESGPLGTRPDPQGQSRQVLARSTPDGDRLRDAVRARPVPTPHRVRLWDRLPPADADTALARVLSHELSELLREQRPRPRLARLLFGRQASPVLAADGPVGRRLAPEDHGRLAELDAVAGGLIAAATPDAVTAGERELAALVAELRLADPARRALAAPHLTPEAARLVDRFTRPGLGPAWQRVLDTVDPYRLGLAISDRRELPGGDLALRFTDPDGAGFEVRLTTGPGVGRWPAELMGSADRFVARLPHPDTASDQATQTLREFLERIARHRASGRPLPGPDPAVRSDALLRQDHGWTLRAVRRVAATLADDLGGLSVELVSAGDPVTLRVRSGGRTDFDLRITADRGRIVVETDTGHRAAVRLPARQLPATGARMTEAARRRLDQVVSVTLAEAVARVIASHQGAPTGRNLLRRGPLRPGATPDHLTGADLGRLARLRALKRWHDTMPSRFERRRLRAETAALFADLGLDHPTRSRLVRDQIADIPPLLAAEPGRRWRGRPFDPPPGRLPVRRALPDDVPRSEVAAEVRSQRADAMLRQAAPELRGFLRELGVSLEDVFPAGMRTRHDSRWQPIATELAGLDLPASAAPRLVATVLQTALAGTITVDAAGVHVAHQELPDRIRLAARQVTRELTERSRSIRSAGLARFGRRGAWQAGQTGPDPAILASTVHEHLQQQREASRRHPVDELTLPAEPAGLVEQITAHREQIGFRSTPETSYRTGGNPALLRDVLGFPDVVGDPVTRPDGSVEVRFHRVWHLPSGEPRTAWSWRQLRRGPVVTTATVVARRVAGEYRVAVAGFSTRPEHALRHRVQPRPDAGQVLSTVSVAAPLIVTDIPREVDYIRVDQVERDADPAGTAGQGPVTGVALSLALADQSSVPVHVTVDRGELVVTGPDGEHAAVRVSAARVDEAPLREAEAALRGAVSTALADAVTQILAVREGRVTGPGVLGPGEPGRTLSRDDLTVTDHGRIARLRALKRRYDLANGFSDRTERRRVRREIHDLIDGLGLRERTPGSAARREVTPELSLVLYEHGGRLRRHLPGAFDHPVDVLSPVTSFARGLVPEALGVGVAAAVAHQVAGELLPALRLSPGLALQAALGYLGFRLAVTQTRQLFAHRQQARLREQQRAAAPGTDGSVSVRSDRELWEPADRPRLSDSVIGDALPGTVDAVVRFELMRRIVASQPPATDPVGVREDAATPFLPLVSGIARTVSELAATHLFQRRQAAVDRRYRHYTRILTGNELDGQRLEHLRQADKLIRKLDALLPHLDPAQQQQAQELLQRLKQVTDSGREIQQVAERRRSRFHGRSTGRRRGDAVPMTDAAPPSYQSWRAHLGREVIANTAGAGGLLAVMSHFGVMHLWLSAALPVLNSVVRSITNHRYEQARAQDADRREKVADKLDAAWAEQRLGDALHAAAGRSPRALPEPKGWRRGLGSRLPRPGRDLVPGKPVPTPKGRVEELRHEAAPARSYFAWQFAPVVAEAAIYTYYTQATLGNWLIGLPVAGYVLARGLSKTVIERVWEQIKDRQAQHQRELERQEATQITGPYTFDGIADQMREVIDQLSELNTGLHPPAWLSPHLHDVWDALVDRGSTGLLRWFHQVARNFGAQRVGHLEQLITPDPLPRTATPLAEICAQRLHREYDRRVTTLAAGSETLEPAEEYLADAGLDLTELVPEQQRTPWHDDWVEFCQAVSDHRFPVRYAGRLIASAVRFAADNGALVAVAGDAAADPAQPGYRLDLAQATPLVRYFISQFDSYARQGGGRRGFARTAEDLAGPGSRAAHLDRMRRRLDTQLREVRSVPDLVPDPEPLRLAFPTGSPAEIIAAVTDQPRLGFSDPRAAATAVFDPSNPLLGLYQGTNGNALRMSRAARFGAAVNQVRRMPDAAEHRYLPNGDIEVLLHRFARRREWRAGAWTEQVGRRRTVITARILVRVDPATGQLTGHVESCRPQRDRNLVTRISDALPPDALGGPYSGPALLGSTAPAVRRPDPAPERQAERTRARYRARSQNVIGARGTESGPHLGSPRPAADPAAAPATPPRRAFLLLGLSTMGATELTAATAALAVGAAVPVLPAIIAAGGIAGGVTFGFAYRRLWREDQAVAAENQRRDARYQREVAARAVAAEVAEAVGPLADAVRDAQTMREGLRQAARGSRPTVSRTGLPPVPAQPTPISQAAPRPAPARRQHPVAQRVPPPEQRRGRWRTAFLGFSPAALAMAGGSVLTAAAFELTGYAPQHSTVAWQLATVGPSGAVTAAVTIPIAMRVFHKRQSVASRQLAEYQARWRAVQLRALVSDQVRVRLEQRRARLAELRQRLAALAAEAEASGIDARTAAALDRLTIRLERLAANAAPAIEPAIEPAASARPVPNRRARGQAASAERADLTAALGSRPSGVMRLRDHVTQTLLEVGGPWYGGAVIGAAAIGGDYNLAGFLIAGTSVAILPHAVMRWWRAKVEVRTAWEREQAEFLAQREAAGSQLDEQLSDPLDQLDAVVDDLARDLGVLERWRDSWHTHAPATASGRQPAPHAVPRPVAESRTGEQRDARAAARPRNLTGRPAMWQEIVWGAVPGLIHMGALTGVAIAFSKGLLGHGEVDSYGLLAMIDDRVSARFTLDADWHRALIGGSAVVADVLLGRLMGHWFARVADRSRTPVTRQRTTRAQLAAAEAAQLPRSAALRRWAGATVRMAGTDVVRPSALIGAAWLGFGVPGVAVATLPAVLTSPSVRRAVGWLLNPRPAGHPTATGETSPATDPQVRQIAEQVAEPVREYTEELADFRRALRDLVDVTGFQEQPGSAATGEAPPDPDPTPTPVASPVAHRAVLHRLRRGTPAHIQQAVRLHRGGHQRSLGDEIRISDDGSGRQPGTRSWWRMRGRKGWRIAQQHFPTRFAYHVIVGLDPATGRPLAASPKLGLLVMEMTEDGMRSLRWTRQDGGWVVGGPGPASLGGPDRTGVPVDRAVAEDVAQSDFGFVLPNEPELHAMLWG